jgi:hypothetical protein
VLGNDKRAATVVLLDRSMVVSLWVHFTVDFFETSEWAERVARFVWALRTVPFKTGSSLAHDCVELVVVIC